MSDRMSYEAGLITGFLLSQNVFQKQLLEAQQEIIQLQKRIQTLTPATPGVDVHWNKVSKGLTSSEVLEGTDLQALQALQEWVLTFGEKYIKPYVHPTAYAEMIAHMSRGIAKRLAELEFAQEFGSLPELNDNDVKSSGRKTPKRGSSQTKIEPIPLFPDEDN